jgi:hypothetical protein
MGETHHGPFQWSFNSALRLTFQGSRVTADGGLRVGREVDDRWGVGGRIGPHGRD